MYYAGESNTAASLDSVLFLGADFTGYADTAFFYLNSEEGLLIGSRPNFHYNNSSIEGDSIRCFFADGSLNKFLSWGEPIVTNTDESDTAPVHSTMIADTIIFHLTNSTIDTVFAYHNAIVARQNGSNTQEADDGLTALPMLKAGNFDFLVTDWNMPGMQGIDLLKEVRADAELAGLPVLMVTAEQKREQIIEAAQAGVNGYIVKPFTAQTLKEKIDKIFERVDGGG